MYELIKKWKVNQTMLSEKMGMALGTFKKKISNGQPRYYFTEEERTRLACILKEMGHDLLEDKQPK